MADNNQQPPNNEHYYVSEREPEAKPPPLLETGWLAWVHENLFSTALNGFLTIIGTLVVVFTLVSLTSWTITQANWFVISFNFRLFMVNQYNPAYEWRVVLALLGVVFIIGMSIAVWIRQIARAMLIFIIVTLAVMWGLPPIAKAIYNLPEFYTVAGDTAVQSGSATEQPQSMLAFVGQGGDIIDIHLSADAIEDDASLAALSGFMDQAGNTLRNAAGNRINQILRENEIIFALEEFEEEEIPTLTEAQQEALTNELENLQVPDPIVEIYDINQTPVQVNIVEAIYEGNNQWSYEPLEADPVLLETPDDVASFELPGNGWYIFEKTLANEEAEGVALLEATGIYPMLQSTSFSQEEEGFVDTFRRMTDFFDWTQPVPRVEGAEVPFMVVTRNQFQGRGSFETYIRTYVTPFLEEHALNVTILLLTGIAGYAFISVMQNTTNNKSLPATVTSYALLSAPLFIWILVNGMTTAAVAMWLMVVGVALLTISIHGIGRMYGSAGWRNLFLPLTIAVGYGLLLLLLNSTEGGGLPRLLVLLSLLPFVMAAFTGTGQYVADKTEDQERNRVILNLILTAAIYVAVFFAFRSGLASVENQWFLSPSDPRSWGGLLLTMILTIFGIIAAFPIGVGLALGRRSDLPAIRIICTGYIELVRGSPFITVLFFMQLLIPLINSDFAEIPNAYRALIAVIMFSAAYLAENVRGGLQSLPPGQVEAAKALGLSAWQTTRLITLPQALRAVIPALVGQFISLFKDTSLVAIVGLIDLTGVVNTIVVQASFIGTRREGLLFISLIYFVFSYVMSYISRLLEASGSGSTRRM